MIRAVAASGFVVALGACNVSDLDLTGKQCPCVVGWTCDVGTNTCVRDPVPDASGDDDGPVIDGAIDGPGAADARVDAMPGATCIGAAGSSLFAEDFADLIGWTTPSGTWAAVASEGTQSNPSPSLAYAYPAGTGTFTDYRIATRMRQLVGSGADAMKIAFRIDTGSDAQYQCGWEPSSGRLQLQWIRTNGNVGGNLQQQIVDIGSIPGYDPLAPVTMEVLVQGTAMTCCLIEITASITASDNRYAAGAPGLGTFQMSAAFDDFRVNMP
jgi:hypothetical protein